MEPMAWWQLPDARTIGEIPEISNLTHDSRLVQPGWGFACLPGRVTDGHAFLDLCSADRHHFRFIVSAEDAAEYEDLKPLTRRLMAQMASCC